MNKNIVLLILATVFIFAGCKKDVKDSVTKSAISLRVNPIDIMSADPQTGSAVCRFSGNIISPIPFLIKDHGFIYKNGDNQTVAISLGSLDKQHSIGYIETIQNIYGPKSDTTIFYIVRDNGDSIKSGLGYNQMNYSTFPISNFTFTDSAGITTQLNLSFSYDVNAYTIGSEILYYRSNSTSPWLPANLPLSNIISNYNISSIPNTSMLKGSYYDFQVMVTLNPITSGTSPSAGSSSIINFLYH